MKCQVLRSNEVSDNRKKKLSKIKGPLKYFLPQVLGPTYPGLTWIFCGPGSRVPHWGSRVPGLTYAFWGLGSWVPGSHLWTSRVPGPTFRICRYDVGILGFIGWALLSHFFWSVPKTFAETKKTFDPLERWPHQMIKHTQTVRRQIANKLFEYVWPFCGVGVYGVNKHTRVESYQKNRWIINADRYQIKKWNNHCESCIFIVI